MIKGATKLKLVPWIDNNPEPIGPHARICIKEAIPDANKDILIMRWVSCAGSPNAWQIKIAGVITATNMAKRC